MVQYVGLFVTGLHTGVLLGLTGIVISQEAFSFRPTIWEVVGLLLCSALLGALANVCWQKSMTIFGTSLHGGAMVAASVDYFLAKFRSVFWMWDHVRRTVQNVVPRTQCWQGWIIIGIWPLIWFAGCLCQSRLTGSGSYREEGKGQRSFKSYISLRRFCSICKLKSVSLGPSLMHD